MDIYLRAVDKVAMHTMLTAAGLIVEQLGKFIPAPGVSLDIIGSITKVDNTRFPPTATVRPGWHVNVRCEEISEEQLAGLAEAMIVPPEQPFRTWA